MNLRIADLHTHSTCSDGAHAPVEVVRLAAAAGVNILSLTDHDTVAGLDEAKRACDASGIEFVRGVEVSVIHEGDEYHVLGYFVEESEELADYSGAMGQRRDARLAEMAARLQGAGLRIDLARLREYAPCVATRSHLARYLVDTDQVASVQMAFSRYLGPECVGFVPAAYISAEEAIGMIHRARGVASLAHPGEWTSERTIEVFARMGLDAVEAVHPSHGQRLARYYTDLAARLDLGTTGGSDFHLSTASNSPGAYRIAGELVDALRRRAEQRAGLPGS